MLQCISPDLFLPLLQLMMGRYKLFKTRTHKPLSHQCSWHPSRLQEALTVQAGSSFKVSFIMQTLTEHWPTSPWVTANFTSWFSQAVQFYNAWAVNTAISCIYFKKKNYGTQKEQGSFSIAHNILNFWNALFTPPNCQTPKIMENFKVSAILIFSQYN